MLLHGASINRGISTHRSRRDMCWRCEQGRSLLIPSGPQDGQRHLFSLLINPQVIEGYGPAPQVFMACVCSIYPETPYDEACILRPGDHPFIRHDSYIDYRRSQIAAATYVEGRVQEGIYRPHGDCTVRLIRRIIACAENSRLISRETKLFLRKVELPKEG